MKIGVLAVQGAFIEHEKMLEKLGIESVELRQKSDWNHQIAGLILPGGESTVQGKLLRELDLFHDLQQEIQQGLPVLGTCAGLILLAQRIYHDTTTHFQTMPIEVKRNAYGRQLGSFSTKEMMKHVGLVDMEFIRAPYILDVADDVEVLATVNHNIVAARYENQLGLSFHPELTKDTRIHEYFLSMI